MRRMLTISGSFCLLLSIMILTLPLSWILSVITAAVFHELCHYAAIRLCGGRGVLKQIYAWKAGIMIPEMGRGKELLCALAGPVGGFLLLLLLPICPQIALCGCVQSLYNLLPIYPLDGGRAVSCLCSILLPPSYAYWLCHYLQWICIGAMIAVGLYFTFFLRLGIFPLLIAVTAAVKANYTCKQPQLALQ